MFFVIDRPPLLELEGQRLGERSSVTSSYHQNPKRTQMKWPLRTFHFRLLRKDLSYRRSNYKINYLRHSYKLEIICRRHVLVNLVAYRSYVGAGQVNKAWPLLWFLRGFSNRVTLTRARSQRRANKQLTFASFLRWSRLRVLVFSVRAI